MLGVVRDLRSPKSLADPADGRRLPRAPAGRVRPGPPGPRRDRRRHHPRRARPRSRRSWPRPGCGPGRSSRVTPTGSWATTSTAGPKPPAAARPARSTCSTGSWRLRYRGELHELTGRLVGSPIDEVNRPRHSGDFTVRVPPSPAALTAFFAGWRGELASTRKWLTATRHYAMARLAAEVGLRLRELCALGLERPALRPRPAGQAACAGGQGRARVGAAPAAGAHAGGRSGAAGVVGHRGPRRVPRRLAAATGAAVPSERGGADRRRQLRGRAGGGRRPAPGWPGDHA